MRHVLLATMLLLLCAPTLAPASTYQWRGDDGVTHFTDNPDSIPERYLKRAEELDSIKAETNPSPPSQAAGSAAAVPAPITGTVAPDAAVAAKSAQLGRLAFELRSLQEDLAIKKKELARLHHKWSVAKGRTPTKEEIKEFEKKKAVGKASFKDNPYVNKAPLSSPIPARVAYYKKLEEIRTGEEKIRRLEQELQSLQ